MDELAIKIEHVSKEYRLGAIGGGTLRGDLQSWWARTRGKEDPNRKIGEDQSIRTGERFKALDDVSFEVRKGEAVGIIGHNGAGKSTLLKLLSRVTAPTTGRISYNGRIASMLEVGTGFHPELTGRENIYMNGAILGMTRAEIDKKFDQIVEFAEMEQFIDTPVKRYSSGMYVKLAFSVAAHLDAEIMIMDEVLAVGDMAFQKKCLAKMHSAAKDEGRTVLYVSHNMSTIRTLCDRCIVLDHGHAVYNGAVEEAIAMYMGHDSRKFSNCIVVNPNMRDPQWANPHVAIEEISAVDTDGILSFGDSLTLDLKIRNYDPEDANVYLRIMIKTASGTPISMSSTTEKILIPKMQEVSKRVRLNMSQFIPTVYSLSFVLYDTGSMGVDRNIDVLRDIYLFSILTTSDFNHGMTWNPQWWGHVSIGELTVL